ncbi:MAG: FtsX-like permease family protein [Lachnospiraceae bacterium]
MYAKLILKNVWKNIKDYGIYFLTLLIAVAVFYAFNSIEAQPAFQESMDVNTQIAGQLIPMLHIVSKLIAVLLAFLIVYANQFLLKRRKRELAIYMILGMSGKKISTLFVCETIVIAAAAVASGIGVGCLFSQGISVFALKMFHYDLSSYRFCFSVDALQQTLICFVLIFALVIVFNMYTILKVKLIELLQAGSKNETMAVKQNVFLVVMLICAGILYAVSAYLIYEKEGFSFKSKQSVFCVIALCMATAMVIYSLSGLILKVLRRKESWYFKGINAFFVRQISSKIQTNFVTMTVITLMLTGTICIVSLGMGMADSMNRMIEATTSFDLMVEESENVNRSADAFYQDLKESGLPLEDVLQKKVVYNTYNTKELQLKDVLADQTSLVAYVLGRLENPIPVIRVSDYNAAMKLQGKPEIQLKENTYRMNSNFKFTNEQLQKKMDQNLSYQIAGVTLKPESTEVLHNNYYLSNVGENDMATMIVPDAVAEKLTKAKLYLIGVYRPDYEDTAMEEKVVELSGKAYDNGLDIQYLTANDVSALFYGSYAMLAFVCCYLGVILLIICVAILALQQLTETNDNISRYRLLGKLGVEEHTRNKTLLKQMSVYFGVPLLIAVTYASAALPRMIEKMRNSLGMEVGTQMLFLSGMVLVIYGSYFVVTYVSCRRMIREEKRVVE